MNAIVLLIFQKNANEFDVSPFPQRQHQFSLTRINSSHLIHTFQDLSQTLHPFHATEVQIPPVLIPHRVNRSLHKSAP